MVFLDDLKRLRQETQVSLADCRQALEEAGGDFGKAKEILRRKGVKLAEEKSERCAGDGVIEAYVHSDRKTGVLLELRTETDFVARSEPFRTLAHEIVLHITAMNPIWISPGEIPADVIEAERNIYKDELRGSGKPQKIINQIIEGRLKKYAEDHCLLTQPYIRDEDKTIQDLINDYIGKLGENIKVARFIRYHI